MAIFIFFLLYVRHCFLLSSRVTSWSLSYLWLSISPGICPLSPLLCFLYDFGFQNQSLLSILITSKAILIKSIHNTHTKPLRYTHLIFHIITLCPMAGTSFSESAPTGIFLWLCKYPTRMLNLYFLYHQTPPSKNCFVNLVIFVHVSLRRHDVKLDSLKLSQDLKFFG